MMWNFFRAQCPVTLEDKEWTEKYLSWLCQHFNSDPLLGEMILPNSDYFPDPFDGSKDSIMCLLNRVCKYMRVETENIDVILYDEENTESEIIATEGPKKHIAGTYSNFYRPQIKINLSHNNTPTSLVATMAHELSHFYTSDKVKKKHKKYEEPITDLATIFFGFGIFTANAKIQEATFQYGEMSAWSISSHGYLPLEIICYSLSLIAWAREQQHPTWSKYPKWMKYLSSSGYSLCKQGIKYLNQSDGLVFQPYKFPAFKTK